MATNNCHCMEAEPTQYTYPAIEQPHDPALIELRRNLGMGSFLKNLPASLKLVYTEQKNERLGKCIYYTITQLLGITHEPVQLKIIEDEDWLNNITLINYFNNTVNPQLGDLAVYYHHANNKQPLHFGIVTGFNPTTNTPIITSKWGTMPYVFQHELFAIPLIYGDVVQFFTLKNQYHQPGKKTIMLKELQSAIAQSDTDTKIMFILQVAMLQFASGKDIEKLSSTLRLNKQLSIPGKVLFILKAYPGFNVDVYNSSDHHTLLMLAALRGDHGMVNMFLTFGADVNKQDKNGNTALILASQNGFDNVVRLLLAHGADQTIQNNNGDTAASISQRRKQTQISEPLTSTKEL